MKTISYAITVNNELLELQRLVNQITNFVRPIDEIVILQDESGFSERNDPMSLQVKSYIQSVVIPSLSAMVDINYFSFPLNSNFANFKNKLKDECKKDYILFLDADEYVSDTMISNIATVVENNDVDVMLIPRLNTVTGLTQQHIEKWGWRVDDKGRVNWPDFQMRLVANRDHLKWVGKVHETVEGYRTVSHFPFDNEDWCLIHPKTIEKQELQNSFYNTI